MSAQTNGPAILFRTDVSVEIGTGHFMRCFALAKALQRIQRRPVFAFARSDKRSQDLLGMAGIDWLSMDCAPGGDDDLDGTLGAINRVGPEWVVLDGYHFDEEYSKAIKESRVKVLRIDDNGSSWRLHADAVLNQNLYADPTLYPNDSQPLDLLLGPDYSLIRAEFLDSSSSRKPIPEVATRLLITLGGTDPGNKTREVLEILELLDVKPLRVKVVAGVANPNSPQLERYCRASKYQCELLIAPSSMPQLMGWADLAITAAGTTVYELLFMRTPFLAISIAENQERNMQELVSRGITKATKGIGRMAIADLIREAILHDAIRKDMIARAKGLVDGLGCMRVASFLGGGKIRLRRARPSDSSMVWQWANDPETRSNSFSMASISWEEHSKWFEMKIRDEASHLFIAENRHGTPIGVFRADVEGSIGVISVSMSPEWRGAGLGTAAIDLGSRLMFEYPFVMELNAFVKTGNPASLKAFEKAGYDAIGTESYRNIDCWHLRMKRIGQDVRQ